MEAGAFPWTLSRCSFKTVLQRTRDFQFSCAWWSISASYRIFSGHVPPFPFLFLLSLSLFLFFFISKRQSYFSLEHKHMISTWKCGNLDAFMIATD